VTFSSLGIPPVATTYPPWKKALIETVDVALCAAWERLKANHANLLAVGDEDRLTDQLKTELVALRRAKTLAGFNDAIFGMPVRDAKLRDGSGSSIDTTPDLTIYLSNSRMGIGDEQFDGLFFECKVLSKTRALRDYDSKGIARFTSGWYASRMPHAGLIGYAIDGKYICPATSLKQYFSAKRKGATQTKGELARCSSGPTKVMKSPGAMAADVAETVHGRQIKGVSSPHSDVALRHLWLLP
jgi:hypothetical protein